MLILLLSHLCSNTFLIILICPIAALFHVECDVEDFSLSWQYTHTCKIGWWAFSGKDRNLMFLFCWEPKVRDGTINGTCVWMHKGGTKGARGFQLSLKLCVILVSACLGYAAMPDVGGSSRKSETEALSLLYQLLISGVRQLSPDEVTLVRY